ncbi:MAG: nucleoside triphosphate pyrophosphohydrolase family protein [Brevundimonas sp.]|jgi:NTP pyrophosphatase (non-canonical NTP hydrolase)|uniref:nucleoside triphosphate pyrophosphohydrolase family protein n=1 Tax=Brevundimonas sp. TaxID=1871086 RepID=UPI00391ABDD6
MIGPLMGCVWIVPVSYFDPEQDSLNWANRVTEGRRRNRGIVTAGMDGSFTPLTVTAYADQAAKTDRGVEGQSLAFPLLGLFGETGSLLSALKKKQRDRASSAAYSDAVAEELGDVLWYLAAIARRGGLSLSAIAAHLYRKDEQWLNQDDATLTFEALQPHTIVRTAAPLPQFEETLLALAAEVGAMVADHQNAALVPGGEALARRLTNVFKLLLKASREAGLTLEGAAVKNQHKILGRWPEEKIYPAAPDADKDSDEQLPRQMAIEVFEKSVGDRPFVFQRCNELFIGDRLTDNAHEADDYRFHDVFHYAFVAVLGWSPVVRSLLRLKRKSDAKLDETEDGARAILIEEGISTWVFSMARPLDYFRDMKAGELPLDLLKQVHQFVQGYEPQDYPLWLWEEAILQGYEAFRFLQEHRRGLVTIDFENRQLRIEPLTS